jgi:hypothetical protein
MLLLLANPIDGMNETPRTQLILHHEKVDMTNKHYLAISRDKKRDVIGMVFN